MMSKIKSSKLSNVKTLSGILTAIALIMVFACEQKEMVTEQEELPGNVSVSLADGGVLQLSGDSNAIQKLQAMLEKNPDIEMTAEGPGLKITPKSKDMGEVSVVGFGEQAAKQDPVFFTVEEMPEFPGGELALRKFIARGIKYPSAAREKGIQGKVYVNFVVEKDGSVGRMKIARGVDPSLDREALRVMGSLPRWEPGRQKGVPVAVSYTVPINFALQ